MKQFTYYCMDCDRHLCDECYKTHLSRHKEKTTYKLSEVPDISKSEDHLNYLSSLRNKFNENNQIQEAYQKCLTSNKDVLYLVNLLMKEYHKDNYSVFKVMKEIAKLNTQKAFDCDIRIQREKNSHCMCAQLDNGSIVSWEEKKKKIIYSITKDSYKKEFETPNLHEKNYFQKMIDLSENRLAACSESQEVKI